MGRLKLAVHDLVRVDYDELPPALLRSAPVWAASSLQQAPWMVIRRERPRNSIAVGIRGDARGQRYAACIRTIDVRGHVVPQELCRAATRCDSRLGDVARRFAVHAAQSGLAWGPTGSFGFELASGRRATMEDSDFDVIVRATGIARETLLRFARGVAEVAAESRVRIDVELAFGCGGVALSEYSLSPARVVAKTARGPQIVPCP